MRKWTQLERETANLVRISNRKINEFRTSLENTDEHEIAKLIAFRRLRRLSHELITEAIFLDGQRADILSLTSGTAIEIMHTETFKKLNEKNYPVPVVAIKSKEVINNEIDWELLW